MIECRSYYRCTTQKCTVKKRVERSFQDPSIVVTTYEGQHNHHCPVTLRGNAGAAMMLSSSASSPGSLFASASMGRTSLLPPEFLAQLLPSYNQGDHQNHHNMFHQNPNSSDHHLHQQHQHQLTTHDYGLLQDLLPSSSSFHGKQEPWTHKQYLSIPSYISSRFSSMLLCSIYLKIGILNMNRHVSKSEVTITIQNDNFIMSYINAQEGQLFFFQLHALWNQFRSIFF